MTSITYGRHCSGYKHPDGVRAGAILRRTIVRLGYVLVLVASFLWITFHPYSYGNLAATVVFVWAGVRLVWPTVERWAVEHLPSLE